MAFALAKTFARRRPRGCPQAPGQQANGACGQAGFGAGKEGRDGARHHPGGRRMSRAGLPRAVPAASAHPGRRRAAPGARSAPGRPRRLDIETQVNRNGAPTEGNPTSDLVGALAGDGNLTGLIGAALKIQDKFAGARLRARWLIEDRYTPLRNAAWLVRNSRVGQGNNPLALGVVVAEVERLLGAGECLTDVVEALCELLVHP